MGYAKSIRNKLSKKSGKPELLLTSLLESLSSYMNASDKTFIKKAYEYGASAHQNQIRMSGEPYICHPLSVAQILASMRMDRQTISAALLHDVVEDTDITLKDIETIFDPEVASLVDSVSKIDQIKFGDKAEAQAETFRKMILAMVKDIRVILIKLSDRLHNMRTLEHLPDAKRKIKAKETLDIYAPIANRLGINKVKNELEDLCIRYLYPYRYKVIDKAIRKSKGGQKKFVKNISSKISIAMEDEKIDGDVIGREKELFSIYNKMKNKKRYLDEVVDVFGFRIVVSNVNDCYKLLGVVHNLYKPMPGRFKDYIAIPRINGYQSLHTTLFGPKGLPIEIQIRTKDMDRVAESGVAAHWKYKTKEKEASNSMAQTSEWLRKVGELQEDMSSTEFLENVKIDLFPDKIYVFTPQGDIIPLRRGSTVIDFAYAVHTDVGNRCIEAEINRELSPLKTILQNGQTVSVITKRGAKPNPDWINFAVTAKARSSIQHYLKNMRKSDAYEMGKKLLNSALDEIGTTLRKIGKKRQNEVLDQLGVKSLKMLYEQIGIGDRLAPLTARFLAQDFQKQVTSKQASLEIQGTEGMVMKYGVCCHPIPGDDVMGYMSSGRGVVIHRNNCRNLKTFRKHPTKWLSVSWTNRIDREFSSQIHVETDNKTGVLAEVASTIADSGSNIESVTVSGHEVHSELIFTLSVTDRIHLANIIRNIRKMKSVHRISREKL
jgi:RelA/SpoT family (p)ppGpp synthetase